MSVMKIDFFTKNTGFGHTREHRKIMPGHGAIVICDKHEFTSPFISLWVVTWVLRQNQLGVVGNGNMLCQIW